MPSRNRAIGGVLLAAFALTSCATTVREQIYKADNTPVSVESWTKKPPQPLTVQSEGGLALTGYYWPGAADDHDVLVFFHGRGSNQGVGARYAEHLTGHGDHVIVASYRGFGGNPGKPTQAGLVADGRAFVAKAKALVGPKARIFLVGHSLGGAVALHVAATVRVAGVVTLSTFDKLEESAPGGVSALLPDKWNNLDAVTKIGAPFIMFQGSADDRVDLGQAAALFATARTPAVEIMMPGAGHAPDMSRIGPLVTQAVQAIDTGKLTVYPTSPPSGWTVRRK